MTLAFVFTGAWSPGLNRVEIARSFFGVHQIIDTADSKHRLLFHGTTIHGAMALRDEKGHSIEGRPEPLTYYYFGGPISEGIAFARAAHGLNRVAVVGLGAGSLACHRQGKESWTFYEIDPEVIRIAQDPKLFNFLSACAPQAGIVLGDARLTLAAAREPFDLIVLDAFSSDAIPVHLLTREAFAIYRKHLSPHGMIVIHISNRHIDLEPVVAAQAAVDGAVAFIKRDKRPDSTETNFKNSSIVVAFARTEADLRDLVHHEGWQRARVDSAVSHWTDDYSNILGLIVRKYFGP